MANDALYEDTEEHIAWLRRSYTKFNQIDETYDGPQFGVAATLCQATLNVLKECEELREG